MILLKDIQKTDKDIKLIIKGEQPTNLGFKTNIKQKAYDVLHTKRDTAIQQLRELLNGENEEEEDRLFLVRRGATLTLDM